MVRGLQPRSLRRLRRLDVAVRLPQRREVPASVRVDRLDLIEVAHQVGPGGFDAALVKPALQVDLQPQRQECKLAVRDYTVDGNKQDLQKTFSRAGEFDLAEVLAKISIS